MLLLWLACEQEVPEPEGEVVVEPPESTPCEPLPYYQDADRDGYGGDEEQLLCEAEPGWVLQAGDCDDDEPEVYPGATERCGERDEDCDGLVPSGAELGGVVYSTLEDALYFAQDGDVLTVCPGEHHERDLVVSQAVTIRGGSADPAETVLDPQGEGIVFEVIGGSLVLEDLTVRGSDSHAPIQELGTSAVSADVPLTVRRCVFEDNVSWAGAAAIVGVELVIEDSTFRGNLGTQGIGAVHVRPGGSLAVSGSTFTDNAGFYGAIYAQSPTTLSDSTFQGNRAAYGGALSIEQVTSLVMDGVTMEGNSAVENGGAISFYASALGIEPFTVTLTDTLIADNEAGVRGGALYLFNRGPGGRWTGGTLRGNAAEDGGALSLNPEGELLLEDLVLEDNLATDRGGGLYLELLELATLQLRDSALIGNEASVGGGVSDFSLSETNDSWLELTSVSWHENVASEAGGALFLSVAQGASFVDCDLGSGAQDNAPDDLWLAGHSLTGYAESTTIICETSSAICE